jgi:MSHA pilin protein MshD
MAITIVIMSIALVAIASVISTSVSRSVDPLIQHKAVLLAQAYFDEILTKRFAENTPVGGVPADTSASVCTVGSEPGESRRKYDDVDDYDSLDEMPPRLQTDINLNDYADYRVQVSVICSGLALGLASNADAKVVTLTVDPPVIASITFTAYRGNF